MRDTTLTYIPAKNIEWHENYPVLTKKYLEAALYKHNLKFKLFNF